MNLSRPQFLRALGAAGVVAAVTPSRSLAAPGTTIDVEEATWEIAPGRTVRATTYNGTIPGPLLRFKEGESVAITMRNRTQVTQTTHWHGLQVSPQVDGPIQLGTPPLEPGTSRTLRFKVVPGGTRWYHSHAADLTFNGLVGPLIIDRRNEPGDYDREVILTIHEFEKHVGQARAMDERPLGSPDLSAPRGDGGSMSGMAGMAMPMQTVDGHALDSMSGANMLMSDLDYAAFTINGKMLGAGDPIRVRRGERVRFRIINASATITHRLALPGHRFAVTEMDGNPLPRPGLAGALEMGPGERIDAIVTMDEPGVWVLGSTIDEYRERGMGIVVAYDGAKGAPQWVPPTPYRFAYTTFGGTGKASQRYDHVYDLVLRKSPKAPDAWSINGKVFPEFEPIALESNKRYLLRFFNASMMDHPMHTHGHSFELVNVDGVATSGIIKDTVDIRPRGGRIDVALEADSPFGGRYLVHCHNDQHAAGGMIAVLAYT